MKKSYKLAAAGTLLVGLLATGVSAAQASEATKANPISNLVAALAQKFNLNQSDVQKVFDEQHAAMETQMKADRTAKDKELLAQAVTAGKLTQAQANLITAKKAEIEAGRDAFRASLEGKTKDQIAALMKTQAESLKSWATANNIPGDYLRFVGGFGHGKMGRGLGFGEHDGSHGPEMKK